MMNGIISPKSKKNVSIYSDEDDFFTMPQPSVECITLSHLNNKSSVLCPETQDITSQYLALQQLDAHQRMISRAKGVVDTSAPKSLKSYISIADRKKNRLWRKMHSESQGSVLNDSSDECSIPSSSRSHFNYSKEDENESLRTSSVNKGIQTGMPFSSFRSTTADKISWYLEALKQGELLSQPFVNADNILAMQQGRKGNFFNSQKKKMKGDIMEIHKEQFVNPKKPFYPRILADSHAKSKLREMRCYHPPFRKKKKSSSSHSSDTFESYDEEDDEAEVDHKAETFPNKDGLSTDEETLINRQHFKNSSCLCSEGSTAQHYLENYPDYTNVQRLNENEEDKYLSFLSKVTEDILRSGVYSDRSIQRAFNFHLQFYQNDSNQEKLQSLLEQVLEGLKITSDESEDVYESEDLFKRSTCREPNTSSMKEKSDNFSSFTILKNGGNINIDKEHSLESQSQNQTETELLHSHNMAESDTFETNSAHS